MFDSHFHYIPTINRTPSFSLKDDFIGLEVATEAGDLEERIKLAPNIKGLFFSVGAGPWSLRNNASIDNLIEKIERDISLFGADAIGECGFDNYNYKDTLKDQRELFEREAELSRKYGLPLIIHTRESDNEILSALEYINEKTIMHCFSSDKSVMKKLLERGAKISFSGNITYKGNDHIREALKALPLDSFLYETDSPYLSPLPYRGKPNTPDLSEITLSFIADLRREDRELLREKAIENFFSLMASPKSKVKRESPLTI